MNMTNVLLKVFGALIICAVVLVMICVIIGTLLYCINLTNPAPPTPNLPASIKPFYNTVNDGVPVTIWNCTNSYVVTIVSEGGMDTENDYYDMNGTLIGTELRNKDRVTRINETPYPPNGECIQIE